MLAPKDIDSVVKRIVQNTPVFDPWTQLHFGQSQPHTRVDHLLTQPELVHQLRQVCGAIPEGLDLSAAADRVWQELFVQRSPLSENCRVVLSTLNRVGLREAVGQRQLTVIRQHVTQMPEGEWLKTIAGAAHLGWVGVQRGELVPAGFSHRQFLSLHNLNEPAAAADFAATSHSVLELSGGGDHEKLLPLLQLAAEHQHSLFCEVQQPEALNVLCGLLEVPLPGLRWIVSGADAVLYPMLQKVAQHYPGVRLCGRWRTAMTEVYDLTRAQLDHLGSGFLHGYSKAQVPEQLVGRWVHLRSVLSNVLTEKYKVLIYAGWKLAPEDIERDVISLLQGS